MTSRPHHRTNPQITLERDSLYIVSGLIPLSIPLTSHWELLHVDPLGKITRHHWTTTQDPDYPGLEIYESSVIVDHNSISIPVCKSNAHTSSITSGITIPTHRMTLGYFKVTGFKTPPPEHQRLFLYNVFTRTTGGCFETTEEDRRTGLTSRIWVLNVIETMCDMGVIRRMGRVEEIERVVEDTIKQQEAEWLKEMKRDRRSVAELFSV